MALSLLLQLSVLGGVLWALRSVYIHFIVRSPLDNLPGPPSKSWLLGMTQDLLLSLVMLIELCLGSLPQLFNRYAWDSHKEIFHKYGAVSVVRGMFGVCTRSHGK